MGIRKSVPFLVFFLLFCFPMADGAFITPTQFIRDGETIDSDGGSFKLGFFSPENSKNRYVGIWFAKIPTQTVVWIANRENPVTDSSGVFKIGSDGNLVVLDGKQNIIWSSNVSTTSNDTSAEFFDTGNLVLKKERLDETHRILWESFNHPSDTFIAGMKFGLNLKTGENQVLKSWKSPSDPSSGNFSLGFDPRGIPQIVIWESSSVYWRSGQWNGQLLTGVPEMTSFSLYGFNIIIDDVEGRIYCTYSDKNIPSRFVISSMGKLERSYWIENQGAWNVVWSQSNAECEMYGRCGPFGSCDQGRKPVCGCLPGFEPASQIDWHLGNWSGGCVRRTELQCGKNGSSSGDGFMKFSGVKPPDNSHPVAVESTEDCESSCRRNCSCIAFAYESGFGCLTWAEVLNDIQEFPQGGQDLYIRLAMVELETQEKKKKRNSQKMRFWELGSSKNSNRKFGDSDKGPDLPLFGLDHVRVATDNFCGANKLGEGGFGPVYKGKFPNGQEIAVKRLSKGSGQGLLEFENEVILIAKLQHRNLVRLLGCCIEGEEKLLVYEFMPNNSLDFFLFDQHKRALLDWRKRFNIIEGIARGLLYLHRDSRLRIIHRDLKASNILLDDEMNPKISDFGMAKIFGGNQNQANTMRVVGTYGYMAPEYAMEGLFSVKSDVYSFGVLLLEIISGRRNASFYHPEQPLNLLGYAWKQWKEEKMLELMDASMSDSYSACEVLRCIHVGLLCVQDIAADRPTMDSVVFMLGNEAATLPMPKQPAFSVARIPRESDLYPITSEICSVNDVTISTVQGR
ncbi:G-type lectin S-receptor-like serine/threonine-protein kinase B120 [Magnolia sinica]|uniref:G-type lectin S-receptor-like serine/threonine-protein kinase B120 n=1 Tax=Magnolia sinica TaxID=86752 RepID=UPI00265B3FC6|nr:G-type lectin S-receptor-like serine/threonine-protein kinase B120 [Magnolia sinica]